MNLREFKIENKSIFVIDNLLETKEIKDFFIFVNGLSFTKNERDDDDDEYPIFSVDFETDLFLKETIIGKTAQKLLKEYCEGKYHLYRAYINLSTYGDVEFPHYDCDPNKKDITILYYVNKIWDYKWGGETLFYSEKDTQFAILPKPGRFAIFPGGVEHCGTVPTKICKIPRLTLALKYSYVEE
jgi:Rps23 Pro-64 3,4-dihydroxylase Tpa1-like proline 4-hydroxylase